METDAIAELYRGFAVETADGSPCFTAWASALAEDPELLAWVGALPEPKRQPNLVFAAARWHGAPAPGPYDGFRRTVLDHGEAVRRTILTRATQTNEPRRMACLLPVLGRIEQESGGPLALVEVGASAGLCLHPDRYRYDWGGGRILAPGAADASPVLVCDAAGPLPVPPHMPRVAWRGGLDLDPVDVTDAAAMRWLRTLIWPEQEERRALLDAATAVARADPPHLLRGDVFDRLDDAIALARPRGTVVVLHSAVVAYLDDAARRRFAHRMRQLVAAGEVRWLSNEGDRVLPEITRTARSAGRSAERFVLGLDGRAVARTHGHGASLTWIG